MYSFIYIYIFKYIYTLRPTSEVVELGDEEFCLYDGEVCLGASICKSYGSIVLTIQLFRTFIQCFCDFYACNIRIFYSRFERFFSKLAFLPLFLSLATHKISVEPSKLVNIMQDKIA
jgi:hypothetical protein